MIIAKELDALKSMGAVALNTPILTRHLHSTLTTGATLEWVQLNPWKMRPYSNEPMDFMARHLKNRIWLQNPRFNLSAEPMD